MKSLYLTFDDKEFKKLEKEREKYKSKSWEKFILELIKNAMQK